MSLIVNALRHRSKDEWRDGDRDARTRAVNDPPRYPPRPSPRGLPPERIIGIAAGAMAIGFLAIALPTYWVARQVPLRQAAVRPSLRPMVQYPARPAPAQLLEQDGTSADVHNNLGVAYLLARQLDAAAAELRLAAAIDPGNIESLVNLALVEKAAGRTGAARVLLRRAVTRDPSHAGSHYNLAVIADEGGDILIAVTHYRAFLRYGADGYPDLADPVRLRLATLESD